MALLSPYPKLQFFDDNGVPLAGGKLYAYSAGTNTPKDTYTTSAGTTANANPVILDSAGRATVFLGTGSYKLLLKTSADVTVWTQDNVSGTDSSYTTVSTMAELRALTSGQSNLVYIGGYTTLGDGGHGWFVWDSVLNSADDNGVIIRPTSAPAIGRWVRVLDGYTSPKMYGAVGDGTTSDNTAVSAAQAYAYNNSLFMKVTEGTYFFDEILVIDADIEMMPYAKFLSAFGITLNGKLINYNTNLQIFSGAGTITFVGDYTPYSKPEWWGGFADGTDCYAAMMKARAAHKTVQLGFGTYGIDGVFYNQGHGVKLVGAGVAATTIKLLSAGSMVKVGTHTGSPDECHEVEVSNLTIDGNDVTDIGMHVGGTSSPYAVLGHVHDILIKNCAGDGLVVENPQGMMFDNMNIRNNNRGIFARAITYGVEPDDVATSVTASVFKRCRVYQNTLQGLFAEQLWGVSFEQCNFETNGKAGVLLEKQTGYQMNGVRFERCWFENNFTDGTLASASLMITQGSGVTSYASDITIKNCLFNSVSNPESASKPTGNIHIDIHATDVELSHNYYITPSRVPIRQQMTNSLTTAIGHYQEQFWHNARVYNISSSAGTWTLGAYVAKVGETVAWGIVRGASATTLTVQKLTSFFDDATNVEEWDTESAKGASAATATIDTVKRYSDFFDKPTTIICPNGYSTLRGGADIDGKLYVDGTSALKDALDIATTTDVTALNLLRSVVDDGDAIAALHGSSYGLPIDFVYLTCGSDGARIALRLHKPGVAILRLWVGNDGLLHYKSSDPTSGNDGNTIATRNENNNFTLDQNFSNDGPVIRLGLTNTEGYEIIVKDEDVTLTNAVETNITGTIPAGAVILAVQANLNTLVVGDGTGIPMTKIGVGTTADPDKYGLTSGLTKNLKIDTIPVHAVLSGAEQICVAAVDNAGDAVTEKFVAGGVVRVHIVYAACNSLDNAA